MPSKAWAKGSTRAWRKTRAMVLRRDGFRCQLQLDGCKVKAGEVHHTLGKGISDDPAHLVAACRSCNQAVGDPKGNDPAPRPRTRW